MIRKYLLLIVLVCYIFDNCNGSCESFLSDIHSKVKYNSQTKQVSFQNVSSLDLAHSQCYDSGKIDPDAEFVLELIHLAGPRGLESKPELCCSKPCPTASVQDEVSLRKLVANPGFTFDYVVGTYFFRLRHCSSCSNGSCLRCKTLQCTSENKWGEGSVLQPTQTCANASLAYLSKLTKFSLDSVGLADNENCTLEVSAVFPACLPIQHYSRATVSIVKARL